MRPSISSFVNGELIQAEPLEQAAPAAVTEVARCKQLLDNVFAVLSSWHAPGRLLPLVHWQRALSRQPAGRNGSSSGRFDLSQRPDREGNARGLTWDSAFIMERHLHRHLLEKNRDGLLYDVMRSVKARYTLTHGDLNPRNVLCEEGNVWLIDFEHTGVAPTLIDFARMEVNLRIWCLDHESGGQDLSAAASAFEQLLLQHFHGGEGSLEPVRGMAAALGTDPKELLKLAHCVAHVRTLATPYCNDQYADRRDYLAVLYVTVLELAAASRGNCPRAAANFRVLVSLAWELERVLCHVFGRLPFETERAEASALALLRSDWLDAHGAPGRVHYAAPGATTAVAPSRPWQPAAASGNRRSTTSTSWTTPSSSWPTSRPSWRWTTPSRASSIPRASTSSWPNNSTSKVSTSPRSHHRP